MGRRELQEALGEMWKRDRTIFPSHVRPDKVRVLYQVRDQGWALFKWDNYAVYCGKDPQGNPIWKAPEPNGAEGRHIWKDLNQAKADSFDIIPFRGRDGH